MRGEVGKPSAATDQLSRLFQPEESTMTQPSSDETQQRVAAAIEEADSGSNHQAGVDGDEASTADRAEGEDPPQR